MSSSGTIAIIGGGPRGISVLERLAAQVASDPTAGDHPLTVHLVDDTEPGAGRVWRTNQTRTLCMNTLADAVTLFTEPGSTVTAPVVEGPTLYEWIELIRGDSLSATADPSGAKTALFRSHPAMVRGEFHSEFAATRPESHPSRALYGEYLRWVLSVVLSRLPTGIEVEVHQARATAITQVTGADGVLRDKITLEHHTSGDAAHLASGSVTLTADATVLALGWTDNEPDALEGFTATSVSMHPGLRWVRPGNPADQSVDDIPAGEEVVVRGLGMGFFDLMAMVTVDRGGKFVTDATARSGLAYRPSGRE
uniref:FAD/NAD(P)-binding protein n=1 Tax=uncultured Corynebacterium sp. TaxID=159447 RepID=UPI0025F0775C